MPRRTNDSAPASGHMAPPPATPEREHGTGLPAGARTPSTPGATDTKTAEVGSVAGPAPSRQETGMGRRDSADTGTPSEEHEPEGAASQGVGAQETQDIGPEAVHAAASVTGTGESLNGNGNETATGNDTTPHHAKAGTGADTDTPSEEPGGVGEGSGGDPRVVAVRRVSAAGRRWRVAQLAGCAALLAVALTAGAIVVGAARDGGGTAVAPASAALSPALLTSGDIDTSITALQAHLRTQPRDFSGWATLGLAYVEQARTKGDPSRYPQAERALKHSLDLEPDNDQALAGRAALAAARHDFEDALKYADRALEQNPYSERALSTRIDALVELGRYDDASNRHPGPWSTSASCEAGTPTAPSSTPGGIASAAKVNGDAHPRRRTRHNRGAARRLRRVVPPPHRAHGGRPRLGPARQRP
ncbi:hypothetical protein SALBM311S_02062 [Streptomyces alboniger]